MSSVVPSMVGACSLRSSPLGPYRCQPWQVTSHIGEHAEGMVLGDELRAPLMLGELSTA
jgi:hypothetical protein